MVNDTTVIEAKIVGNIDKQSFSQAVTQVKKVGKEIDKSLQIKINLSNLKEGLREANKQLREARKSGNKTLILEANLKIDKLKQSTKIARNELKKIKGEAIGLSGALTKSFSKMGKSIVKSLGPLAAALGAGAIARGVASLVGSFSDASASIAKSTGAVGESLDQLENDLKAVSGAVPQSLGEVAIAIGDINTRFKLTGTELQSLTKDFLDFSRVTGQDVAASIKTVSRLSKDFGLDADEIPLLLDKLTLAAQKTGIEVGRLSTVATNFGVQFRAIGFGIDETIALISKFEAEGVNTEAILAGLNTGVAKLAKETGKTLPDAFDAFLKSLSDAGSESEAISLAVETLGQRAGPQLALAVREGRLELGNFVEVLQGAEGALDRTAEASLTVGERLKTSLNTALSTLQPLFEGLGNAIISLLDGFENFGVSIGLVSIGLTGLGVAVGVLTGPIGILVGSVAGLVSIFGFLSQSTSEVPKDLANISKKATQLAGQLDIVTEALKNLDQQYKDGLITQSEFINKSAELEGQSNNLTKQLEAEALVVGFLNSQYNESQDTIAGNIKKISELKGEMEVATGFAERFGDKTGEYSQQIKGAQEEIDKLIEENRLLSEVQKIQITTQEEVNATINELSATKTLAEFDAIRKAQVAKIKGDVAVIESELAVQSALGGAPVSGARFAAAQQGFLDTLKLQRQISDLEAQSFKEVEDDDDKDPPGFGSGRSKAAKEEADKIAKIKKDADDAEAKRVKDLEDAQQAALDKQVSEFKLAFDAIGDSIKSKESAIKDFTSEIEKSANKIADIDDKIAELGASTSGDLASRFVAIQEELGGEDLERDEKKALEEELRLIKANTTEEERREAIRVDGLSTTESILEAKAAELLELENLRATEEANILSITEARNEQQVQLNLLRAVEEELSNRAIEQVQKEFTEKTKAAKEYETTLDRIIRKQAEAILSGAGGIDLGSTGTGGDVIDQSSTTVNVGGVVVNEGVTGIEDIGAQIIDEIKNAEKQE